MPKSICLDTNIAIHFLKRTEAIVKEISKQDILYVPFVVAGELLYGAKKSTKRESNLNTYRSFLAECSLLFANEMTAEIYSDIKFELKKSGKPIPMNDLWVATIAKQNSLTLFTCDKHFTFINGLDIKYIQIPN